MDRVVTKRERAMVILGFAIVIGVAAASGKQSWSHISGVARNVGEQDYLLIPFSVDGMMLAGAAMSAVDRLRGFEPRGWATVSLWLGTIMTVAFNCASAWARGWAAVAVALVPAVALVVTVETVFKPSRRMIKMASEMVAAFAHVSPVPPPLPFEVDGSEGATDVAPPATVPVFTEPGETLPTANLTKRRARPRRRAASTPVDAGVPVEA